MEYCTAHIDLDSLAHNWNVLRDLAASRGGATLLPVVKADAYGHGLLPVARTLYREGARLFALGSVAEAAFLRGKEPFASPEVGLVSLLGANDGEEAALAQSAGIVPLVHAMDQLPLLEGRSLDVAVKVDTGMSRLGFGEDEVPDLLGRLAAMPSIRPRYLVSHLASADEAGCESDTASQCERFSRLFALFREKWPDMVPSLANSAGLVLDAGGELDGNLARPGYSLYGGQPFPDREVGDLLPVMSLSAPVISVRDVRAGAKISYGGTFTAPEDMRIAVVAAGYSDGLPRALKGRGEVCLNKKRHPLVGRLCMQMCLVDIRGATEPVRVGDRAWFLGGQGEAAISADRLALAWGTIPYELFCILGKNTRSYTP